MRVDRSIAITTAALLATALFFGVARAEPRKTEPAPEPATELSAEHERWLAMVDLLITEQEREYFLSLTQEFRRRAFIDAFWEVRDPHPETHTNELRGHWEERAEEVWRRLGNFTDDRAKIYFLNGEPDRRCRHLSQAIEIWAYVRNPDMMMSEIVPLIFYKRTPSTEFELWRPFQLLRRTVYRWPGERPPVHELCNDDEVEGVRQRIDQDRDYELKLQELLEEFPEPSEEWVATFAARSTELPSSAETFPAELELEFPGRHQNRTVVQGVVAVDRAQLGVMEGASGPVHQLVLLGEVVRDGELFDAFRYRFEVPAMAPKADGAPSDRAPSDGASMDGAPASSDGASGGGRVPLVFQRYLRPGEFTLLLKIEDLFGRRFARLERDIEVPRVDGKARGTPRLADSELFQILAEANDATRRGERSIRILPPPGVVHSGLVRFTTLTTGDVEKAVFYLDEQPIFTKNRPPYSVELDLGAMPGIHRLRVAAYDAEGAEVAADEILLNPGGQSFRVRLNEPRPGGHYRSSVRAVVDVQVPDGATLDRLELFLGETLVATLYQPPWVQPIVLANDGTEYVRAVAHLADGHAQEDLVFINAPDFLEEIDVHFVELYAGVFDRQGNALTGLERDAFTVREDGVEQELRRFEWIENLPIHTVMLIDTSSSMEDSLASVSRAALGFVEQTIRPRDRASLIAFDHQPRVEVRFTSEHPALETALEALRAEGGTALYDSLVFALHYFQGVKGQRALLLLSDGKDESSRFDFESALEFARRAGVKIYAIGLKEAARGRGARKVLRQLADETGGRSYFIEDLAELDAIYQAIQRELRTQYLLAYQSSSAKDPSEFRRVEVEVAVDGAEVRTMSGYFP